MRRPIERLLNAVGSVWSVLIVGIWSLAWWGWLRHKHLAEDNLNTAISIWTMLVDVMTVMAANFQRRMVVHVLTRLEKQNEHILEILKSLSDR